MSTPTGGDGPTRISASLALASAGMAAVTALGGSGWWIFLAPTGAVLVATGLHLRVRHVLAAGCASLVAAALVTALGGGAPMRPVFAVAAALVAWDLGEHAIALGEQLGRRADTARLELLHAAGSVAVATAGAGTASLGFLLARGGRPELALVSLLFGVIALLTALRLD